MVDHFPLYNFLILLGIVAFLVIDKLTIKFRASLLDRELLEMKARYELIQTAFMELKVAIATGNIKNLVQNDPLTK